MFALVRVALRSFALGVAVGLLVAPRPGAETRRMLSERIASFVDELLELAALPPVRPERARTNGHGQRAASRRRAPQAAHDPDARASNS